MLLAKPKCGFEVYNDINSAMCDFFEMLISDDEFPRFMEKITQLPSSRELYRRFSKSWHTYADRVDRMVRWFYVMWFSFSGCPYSGWSHSTTRIRGGHTELSYSWNSILQSLDAIRERFRFVQVENLPFQKVLKKYNFPSYLLYADPPYVLDTRSGGETYVHEMTREEHEELVQLLLDYSGMVVLSGYEHEVYKPLTDAGWKLVKRPTNVRVVKTDESSRVECLWLNPKTVEALNGRGLVYEIERRGNGYTYRKTRTLFV